MNRHDEVVKTMARTLNSIQGITATIEPRIDAEQDLRRGDIKVIKNGNTTFLDLVVVCPASKTYIRTHTSHEVPGAAAAVSYNRKRQKYRDVPNLQPISMETGGRIDARSGKFLDDLFKEDNQTEEEHVRRRLQFFNEATQTLLYQQSMSLARFVRDISTPVDLAQL